MHAIGFQQPGSIARTSPLAKEVSKLGLSVPAFIFLTTHTDDYLDAANLK